MSALSLNDTFPAFHNGVCLQRYGGLDLPNCRCFMVLLSKIVVLICYALLCFYVQKNAFEWGLNNTPHSTDAIKLTQLVVDYFIS